MSKRKPTPEPEAEAPDLSVVQTSDLVNELYGRFPDAFAFCAEGEEEGDKPYQIRLFQGPASRVEGMLSRALRIIKRGNDNLDKSTFG